MSRETAYGLASKTLLYGLFGVTRQAVSQALNGNKPVRLSEPALAPVWASAEVLKPAILRVVGEHRSWGVRKVWATLRREEGGPDCLDEANTRFDALHGLDAATQCKARRDY
jgi:hypothetical protein